MKECFALRLKELRLEKRLTLMQLAEKTGISYTALQSYESNKKAASYIVIITLADFFSVTADYLLGRTD